MKPVQEKCHSEKTLVPFTRVHRKVDLWSLRSETFHPKTVGRLQVPEFRSEEGSPSSPALTGWTPFSTFVILYDLKAGCLNYLTHFLCCFLCNFWAPVSDTRLIFFLIESIWSFRLALPTLTCFIHTQQACRIKLLLYLNVRHTLLFGNSLLCVCWSTHWSFCNPPPTLPILRSFWPNSLLSASANSSCGHSAILDMQFCVCRSPLYKSSIPT